MESHALKKALNEELLDHNLVIERANKLIESSFPVIRRTCEIIIQRRTQQIKELKAEALILGIQLGEGTSD